VKFGRVKNVLLMFGNVWFMKKEEENKIIDNYR
jgi:hypothetical protein